MTHRYKRLLDLTRCISGYEDANNRLEALYLIWDCSFISYDLYIFLKRKIIQSAYLSGVIILDYMVKIYFSKNDNASFNHYVIKDKKRFDYD